MTQSVSGVYGSGTNVDIDSSKGITSVAWSASGLPSGLSINSSTGQITGTASSPGTWTATITCTTNYGTVSKAVTVTINKYYPPDLSDSEFYFYNTNCLGLYTTNLTLYANAGIGYNSFFKGYLPCLAGKNAAIDSSKGITSVQWDVTGLPPGITKNDWSGGAYLSGTPTTAGTYTVYITCTTNYGSYTRAQKITIKSPSYPPQNYSLTKNGVRGKSCIVNLSSTSFNYTVDASKDITYVYAYLTSGSSLPSGLSLSLSNGNTGSGSYPKISGTISSSATLGSYTATIWIETNQGRATYTLVLTVKSS